MRLRGMFLLQRKRQTKNSRLFMAWDGRLLDFRLMIMLKGLRKASCMLSQLCLNQVVYDQRNMKWKVKSQDKLLKRTLRQNAACNYWGIFWHKNKKEVNWMSGQQNLTDGYCVFVQFSNKSANLTTLSLGDCAQKKKFICEVIIST